MTQKCKQKKNSLWVALLVHFKAGSYLEQAHGLSLGNYPTHGPPLS